MTAIPQPSVPPLVTSHYTFTLVFPQGEIAVLEVRGASDQEQARTLACGAFPSCVYTVTDGDVANGHAEYFYTWSNRCIRCVRASWHNHAKEDTMPRVM